MADQEAWYIRREFSKARPFDAAENVKVQVSSSAGTSRWVSISSDQFELIINTLAPLPDTTQENRS